MNRTMKLVPFLLLVCVFSVRAEEMSGTPDSGKGVLEASLEKGIRLSEKAAATLEIKSVPLNGNSSHKIPTAALVYSHGQVGAYLLRDGWYKLVPVRIDNRSAKDVVIQSTDLKPKDHIVVEGVALLRVAEMDAFGGGE